MSKNLPEAVVMSSNPDSPLSMDEPDFSGLMALTEASIRRKLSELKYPDSDFSSSQNEDDADQKVVSVAKNQPISLSQTESQYEGKTRGKSLLESPSESSASSDTYIGPQSTGVISNIEQSKSTASDTGHSNMNTNAKEVGDNSVNLVSALEDPELVKLVSLSMKSNKPESELEQRVKYCGLSVELPIENKSPELRKSPEQVTNYPETPTENKGAESVESPEKEMYVLEIHDEDISPESEIDKSPEPEISHQTIKETTEKEIDVFKQAEVKDISDLDKSKTSPLEICPSNSIKHGLNEKSTEMQPQIKSTHTPHIPESVEQDSFVKETNFEPVNIKSSMPVEDEASTVSIGKHSSPTGEISETHEHNMDNKEKVKECTESVMGATIDLHTLGRSAGEQKTSSDTVSEISRSDLSRVSQSIEENNKTYQEIVADKSNESLASSATLTMEEENLMPEKGEFYQDREAVSNQVETAQILSVVSEDIGIDVDKCLAEMDASPSVGGEKEQKVAPSADEMEQMAAVGDDVSQNELGLVISGVCSSAGPMSKDVIQMMQGNSSTAEDGEEELREESVPIQSDSSESPKPADEDVQPGITDSPRPVNEDLPPEVTEDGEKELMDISDDIVMIDIDNQKSDSDKCTKINNDKIKEPVCTSSVICPGINFKITDSNGEKIGSNSVIANSESEIVEISEENLTEYSINTLVRPMATTDTEVSSISKSKIDEEIADKVNELKTNQISSESDSGTLDNVTIANVISIDTSRIQDAASISQTNTELSALESMLMKVTPREPVNQNSELKSTSNTDSTVNHGSLSISTPNDQQTENFTDKSKTGTNNKGQMVPQMVTTNVETAVSALETCENKHGTDQTKDQSTDNRPKMNVDKQIDNAMKNKDAIDSNKPLAFAPNPNSEISQTDENDEKSVKENKSLTEFGEMLMITNVRTISIDEEEKLTEEISKDNDNQITKASDAQTVKGRSTTASMDNISGQEATVLNEQTGTFEMLPARSTSAENTINAHPDVAKNAPASKSAGKDSSSASASLNTGMPVIANTFTIKEEPIDYEPYGMPDKVASSRAKQVVNSQSKNSNVVSECFGMPAEVPMMVNPQPRSQSGSEQYHQGKVMARHGAMMPGHAPASSNNQLIRIRKPTKISNGEVNPLSQNYTQAIQKTMNDAFHRQKSPVTVLRPAASNDVRPATSKVHSYLINGKPKAPSVVVSKPVVSAKSQVFMKHSNGTLAQSQRSYPSVASATGQVQAKPAPVPVQPQPPPAPHKFAMNLKTINIETVGIPMITEMIARKNPVPVYKPPPPPKSVLGDEKTKQTFQCYECGDTFYFTSSLEQHTYRCSMKISYKCEWCRKILDFTNKCQLLSHLRSHMNIDKNQAVPIHIKSDSIEIRTNFDDIIPGKEFKWYNIPEKENQDDIAEAQFLINTTSNGLPSQIIRLCRAHECTECKLTFYKKDDRAKMIHFAPDKNVKPIFCGKCPMYLHNHCGIKAHRRLHEDITKLDFLVCPECGICYEGKLQSIPVFLKHLRTKCFHLSRFSTLLCQKCNSNCTSIEELRHHLTTNVEQYYKCNKCPMALKTLKSFKTHFKQVHEEKTGKDESINEAKAKIIYRCHVCDTLIDDKEFLLSHIEKHLSELKEQAKDYFHCLQCGLIFFEQKSLVNHYKTHRQTNSDTFCTLCRTLRRDLVEFTQHILAQHIAPVFKLKARICELCGLVCVDEHKLRIHECHMKTFAFVVQGDKSAAASQKEHKNKSPRKEAKEVKSKEEKDKVTKRQEEVSTEDVKESSRVADKNGKPSALSPHKQSPVKSENITSKYRPIMPKPSREDDAIPLQYEEQCPYCGDPYSSNFRRIEHLKNHKNDKVFICPYCEAMNFKNNDELEYHENDCSKKTNWDSHDRIPKHLSKKCPSCNYVYGGMNKRHYHIKAHRGDKVFICLYCDAMNFTNYPELRSHEVVCSALNKTTVKSTDKSPSRNKIKLKISKGKPSKTSSSDQPTHYQLEYKCDECGECFSRKEKQEEHTRLEHGIHPCHLCGLMYESQTSLKKHLLISHEGKKCVYYCWVCKRRRKFFSDVSHLHKHFTMKHKYRVWDPAKAVPELPGMATQDSCKAPQPAKRRIETTPEIPDTPVKKLRIMSDKGFKCAKCSFVSEERKDFQAHIKEHKMDDSVQCIECGLSFMVIPSLKKHLFMVHKVKDFEAYLKEQNIEDLQEPAETDSENESDNSRISEDFTVDEPMKTEDPSEESEEDEGNPLECKVCYKKFETEHLMKSHMRVHGMAFIKKTRRSLSSAAKKQKLESNEDQSESDRAKSVDKHAESVE